MEDDKDESVAPALAGITRCLHHQQEWIIESSLTAPSDNEFVITGIVTGGLEGEEESQSAPESEQDEDQGDEDEFLVQVNHGRCDPPL